MARTRKTSTTIIALATLAAAAPFGRGYAAEVGFYMAGSYGRTSRSGIEQGGFDQVANDIYASLGFAPDVITEAELDDGDDSGYAIFAGYRLTPHIAVEGGYVNLGEVEYRNSASGIDLLIGQPASWTQKLSTRVKGFVVSAVGVLPLSYVWEVYGRGGLMLTTNDLEAYVTDNQTFSVSGTSSESSTDLLAGAGVSMGFAEVYGVRLEYLRVFSVGGSNGAGEGDVDYLSLGFAVAF